MEADMQTFLTVAAAVWAWCIVLWGWPGNPFEFVAQTPATPAIPTNQDLTVILHHYERIFSKWAQHADLQLIAMVGTVAIVCWMAIRLTRIHVENPRVIHHYHGAWQGHELEQKMTPPKQLESPGRNTLPATVNARSV